MLFDLNLLNGSLSKLQTLPDDITQVQWSPDGNHALVIGGRNQIYLFSYKSGELTDLQPTIGSGARQFLWLAPLISK